MNEITRDDVYVVIEELKDDFGCIITIDSEISENYYNEVIKIKNKWVCEFLLNDDNFKEVYVELIEILDKVRLI